MKFIRPRVQVPAGTAGDQPLALLAKRRETSWSQAAALRTELQGQIDELREEIRTRDTELADTRARLSNVEGQLAAMQLDRRTLPT
ncbi:hypothetical protein [Deinococcus budaensis]|uniref:Chromosome segregation ATPase n=1 Tax=Deinococcus budaensis TaxID=1665626 RepID=A0A7W8GD01_9DEIO|nr:hypothetical protein [Deinococcus budaensis]MBB5233174.1 chromosome segregation ATPase [Deinococcus budaensis]